VSISSPNAPPGLVWLCDPAGIEAWRTGRNAELAQPPPGRRRSALNAELSRPKAATAKREWSPADTAGRADLNVAKVLERRRITALLAMAGRHCLPHQASSRKAAQLPRESRSFRGEDVNEPPPMPLQFLDPRRCTSSPGRSGPHGRKFPGPRLKPVAPPTCRADGQVR
jgi:hypothetical protein